MEIQGVSGSPPNRSLQNRDRISQSIEVVNRNNLNLSMVRSTSVETIPELVKAKSGANPRSMN